MSTKDPAAAAAARVEKEAADVKDVKRQADTAADAGVEATAEREPEQPAKRGDGAKHEPATTVDTLIAEITRRNAAEVHAALLARQLAQIEPSGREYRVVHTVITDRLARAHMAGDIVTDGHFADVERMLALGAIEAVK